MDETKTGQNYIEEFISMDDDEEEQDLGKSEVTEFYEGLNVFLTGGSGFLGRLLAEKLLRFFCEIYRIFFLKFRWLKLKIPA